MSSPLPSDSPRPVESGAALPPVERAASDSLPRLSLPPIKSCLSDDTVANASGSNVVTPNPTSAVENGKEKVGRWTESEHQVFLQGLDKHGKQWKLIAGMIGTRTVVQVRTHAQKYFQRMDRHGTPTGSINSGNKLSNGAAKRKMSLPASLPSRVNKKGKAAGTTSKKILRSSSLTLVPSSGPPPTELPSFPSYVSHTSADAYENISTVSPNGVVDIIDSWDIPVLATSNDSDNATDDAYEFEEMGQDPLEWLVDTMLPESSLPVFPDLGNHESLRDPATYPTDDSVVEDALMNNMVDPCVTVQSLFLPLIGEDDMIQE